MWEFEHSAAFLVDILSFEVSDSLSGLLIVRDVPGSYVTSDTLLMLFLSSSLVEVRSSAS